MHDTDIEELKRKTREQVLGAIEGLEAKFGVELQSLFDSRRYSSRESFLEFRARITDGVNRYQGFDADDQNTSAAKDVELEPNIFISRYNALIVRDYTGKKVYEYVVSTSKALEALSKSTSTAEFVATTMGSTLIAIGVPVAIKVAARLIAKDTLKVALTTAVKGVGLKSAIVAVALALAGVLYWLIWGIEQKILGAIINDTDTDYYVPEWRDSVNGYHGGNLYMQHGTTENFMASRLTGNEDSPEIQLKSRFVDEDDQKTMVAMGLFFADRKAGFRGAEGLYVFIPYPDHGSDPGFAYQFAVPYTKDNRANISIYSGGPINDEKTMSKMFRQLYDSAGVDRTKIEGDITLTSHLNDNRTGDICGIACISKPINYAS